MNETLKRSLSGAVYILILLACILCSADSFFILFGIFLLIATFEFCKLTDIGEWVPCVIAAAIYGFFYGLGYNQTYDRILLGITLLVSIKCIFFLFSTPFKRPSTQSAYLYLIGYVVLPFVLITKIPFGIKGYNPKIILSIFILIWTNDTFAYIVGKSVGRHKLLERISPKKTLEGFAGGILFTILAGYLISRFYFNPVEKYLKTSVVIWTVTAFIVSLFGTLGDLIESRFKRLAGVKDSGKIMPGHGGILDRLDSIIFVAPFVYLFYQLLHYVTLP